MGWADFGSGVQDVKAAMEKRLVEELERAEKVRQFNAELEQRGRGYDLEQRRVDLDERKFNQPEPEPAPMVVGGRLVTRTGDVLFEPPAEPERPQVLSPGSALAQGGRIVLRNPTAGPTPKEPNRMWVIRNGKPAFISENDVMPGDLPGNTREQGRPSLGAEKNALNFFNRMIEAERNARDVEDKVTGGDVLASEYAPSWLENWLKTPEGQQYTQAQRTFTEARLRKESGAAIPMSEFDTDRKTNFRSPGDAPDVLKKKRASRLTTMRGIGQTAGRALQEYYGEDATLDSILKEFAEAEAATGGGRGPNVGDVVTLKNGQRVTIKAIHPDGSFDY